MQANRLPLVLSFASLSCLATLLIFPGNLKARDATASS